MSFVAQPYERFVDDLLTALTGGHIREEHQFVGVDAPYVLTTPGALPLTLRVFGQRNASFTTFDLGADYGFEAGTGSILWRSNGRIPDERSYFYVNYHVTEAVRRLTDRNPGSVTTTLAEAFAREFAVVHKQMEMIYRSAFVDLATDTALDQVVALLGLTRKDAKFAIGEVLFKRSSPAPGDIAIPSGTLVSTLEGHTFETTDRRTLRRGQLSVIAPIRALVEGPAGKVETGTIQQINRPLFGVEAVVNEAATFFATTRETDEELRRRLKASLERAGKSTVDAIKYSLIEDIVEITDANIQVAERPTEPGYVDVKLGLETTADPDLVRRVEESIFYARPAGVRVLHNLPTASATDAARRADAEQGGLSRDAAIADFAAYDDPPDAVSLEPPAGLVLREGVLPLRAEALLRLTEPNLSAAQQERITDDVRTAIIGYIEALPMGAPLMYNKLLGQIVQPESIADAALRIGLALGGPTVTANLATSGRKARIDTSNVYVGLMEEIVELDILVQIQPKPNGTQDVTTVSSQLQSDVQAALQRGIAASRTEVTRDNLASMVRPVVEAAGFQLIAGNAVVLNALYKETGRLLNDTTTVALLEHEVVRLRDVSVRPQGSA